MHLNAYDIKILSYLMLMDNLCLLNQKPFENDKNILVSTMAKFDGKFFGTYQLLKWNIQDPISPSIHKDPIWLNMCKYNVKRTIINQLDFVYYYYLRYYGGRIFLMYL